MTRRTPLELATAGVGVAVASTGEQPYTLPRLPYDSLNKPIGGDAALEKSFGETVANWNCVNSRFEEVSK